MKYTFFYGKIQWKSCPASSAGNGTGTSTKQHEAGLKVTGTDTLVRELGAFTHDCDCGTERDFVTGAFERGDLAAEAGELVLVLRQVAAADVALRLVVDAAEQGTGVPGVGVVRKGATVVFVGLAWISSRVVHVGTGVDLFDESVVRTSASENQCDYRERNDSQEYSP